MGEAPDPSLVGSVGVKMKLICSSLLGAVGKGHFVINIFKNQMSVECRGGLGGSGWAGLLEGEHGRCCDFRFVLFCF